MKVVDPFNVIVTLFVIVELVLFVKIQIQEFWMKEQETFNWFKLMTGGFGTQFWQFGT
jgi:hypothetical protein